MSPINSPGFDTSTLDVSKQNLDTGVGAAKDYAGSTEVVKGGEQTPPQNLSMTGKYDQAAIAFDSAKLKAQSAIDNYAPAAVKPIVQGVSNFFNNLGDKVSSWTPIQRVGSEISSALQWSKASNEASLNAVKKSINKPTTIGSWTVPSYLDPGKDIMKGLFGMSQVVPDVQNIGKDIVVDATVGPIANAAWSLAHPGESVPLQNVLPGATAINKLYGSSADKSYAIANASQVGKTASDWYGTALGLASAGVGAEGVVKAVLPGSGSAFAWGKSILNAGNVGKALAVATGSTAVHLAKTANTASQKAANEAQRYNDLTQKMLDEQYRENNLNDVARNASPANPETIIPTPATTTPVVNNNYYTTNTPPDTSNSGDNDFWNNIKTQYESLTGDTSGTATKSQMWDTIQKGMYTKTATDFTRIVAGLFNNNQGGSGNAPPATSSRAEEYGGGSGRPTQPDKAKLVHKKKHIKPGYDASKRSKVSKLAHHAIQTG